MSIALEASGDWCRPPPLHSLETGITRVAYNRNNVSVKNVAIERRYRNGLNEMKCRIELHNLPQFTTLIFLKYTAFTTKCRKSSNASFPLGLLCEYLLDH